MSQSAARILYVDDEPGNRIVFEQSFAGRFAIDTVASGEEALAALERRSYAVLVTDQRMPGMSGNELLEKVKRQYHDVIRIVITAYDDLHPILRAVNSGLVARYLVKPWDRDELEKLLAWAVEAYEVGRRSSAIQLRLLETERLATIGMLSASVFHDMNQPLAYVNTNAERFMHLASVVPTLRRLLDDGPEPLSVGERNEVRELIDELPELAEQTARGSDVLLSLTRSTYHLFKAADGRVLQPSDPCEVARYAISVCREAVEAVGHEVVLEAVGDVPLVSIEFAGLARSLINLIMNASQAMASIGGGGRITINLSTSGGTVLISVSDDGPGMGPDVLKKAGTLFFTTRPDGTGLGLAQCRRLIGDAGGKFELRSSEGAGCEATVSLPVHAAGSSRSGS